jgi:hypothetical protein
MKDWEIGGVKFANGYAGTGWGNSGFCYTMYKNLAENIGMGGIWNHTIYVLDVKTTCTPKLTMKVTLKHTCRNKLKVTVGVNPDPAATVPTWIQEYPIFNYQGGSLFMQGGTTEADKTIEFGLDLAPVINQIPLNQAARYFLQVQEVDPSNADAGEIVGWSLIDYTVNPPVTINYPSANVPVQNNALTRLYLNYALYLNKPAITNATLPPAQIYQPYSVTLNASGGTPPYKWDVKLDYPETVTTAPFPAVTAQQLTLTNNNTGFAMKDLGFAFPFYKKSVSKLYIYADGYILFDDQPYTYPFLVDKNLLFRQTAIISPFMTDQTIYPSSGQGIWYEGNSSYAIIRWKSALTGMQGSTVLNYAVKLYPNGTIEMYYGDMTFPPGTPWTGGVSSGDNKNFQYTSFSNAPSVTLNSLDKFTSCGFPPEMEISEDGHFTGTPAHSYQNLPIKFQVTDNDNISNTRTLLFSSFGLLINQSILSGNDTLIEFGETATITLNLNNIGTQTFNMLEFTITSDDPFITLVDSTEYLSAITGGQSITLANAFTFKVSPAIPDKHHFMIVLHVQSQGQGFQRELNLLSHSPVFTVESTWLNDGDNGMLDAGETADLFVNWKNTGSAAAHDINLTLSETDSEFTLNTTQLTVGTLKPDSSRLLVMNVSGADEAPAEHVFPINQTISAQNNFQSSDSLYMFSGMITEDFETGDFTRFPWVQGGNNGWYPEGNLKFEGNWASRSGAITDGQESRVSLAVHVLTPGPLTFWKYVSCEQDPSGNHNYDYMAFSVDGYELARWDGTISWSRESFFLTEGRHVLSWVYHKDATISSGLDLCALDFVCFPLISNALPQLLVIPQSIDTTLQPHQSVTLTIFITNTGYGLLNYTSIVFDTTGNKKESPITDNLSGSAMTCNATSLISGEPFTWTLTVQNQSNDNERINQIKIDFPPGMTISSATSFLGGTGGALNFLGSPGPAPSLVWHGETPTGSGVLFPGESAQAVVDGSTGINFLNDLFMVYSLQGDSVGTGPHNQAGAVVLRNQGLPNSWLTLSGTTGQLRRNESAALSVQISSEGLIPGVHQCKLIVKDYFNNKSVIPVTLRIPFPVGDQDIVNREITFRVSPNPVAGHTCFSVKIPYAGKTDLSIRDVWGNLIRNWELPENISDGFTLNWNGDNSQGQKLPPGIYLSTLKTAAGEKSIKMVLIR